eukprot:184571_1
MTFPNKIILIIILSLIITNTNGVCVPGSGICNDCNANSMDCNSAAAPGGTQCNWVAGGPPGVCQTIQPDCSHSDCQGQGKNNVCSCKRTGNIMNIELICCGDAVTDYCEFKAGTCDYEDGYVFPTASPSTAPSIAPTQPPSIAPAPSISPSNAPSIYLLHSHQVL